MKSPEETKRVPATNQLTNQPALP